MGEPDDRASIIDLFERHIFTDERFTDEEPLSLPPDLAAGSNASYFTRLGILDLGKTPQVLTRRTNVTSGRRRLTHRLVWPNVIHVVLEDVAIFL